MKITLRKQLIFLALCSATFLSGCGGGATPEPTQDIQSFSTSAALTVQAKFTETAAAVYGIPSGSIVTAAPFQMEEAEEMIQREETTPQENVVIPGVLSVSEIDGNSSEGLIVRESEAAAPLIRASSAEEPTPMILRPSPTVEVFPTIEPTAEPQKIAGGDKAGYESQEPLDGVHVKAGSSFDVTWFLLNTGTTTWTKDYSMRYFTGTDFTKPGKPRFNLNHPIEPGTVGSCSIDAVAPKQPGTYKMAVVLGNANDENFFIVDITINVD